MLGCCACVAVCVALRNASRARCVQVDFAQDANGNPTKTAIRMHSKEGEFVDMTHPCEFTGQVEVYLNRMIDCMRASLRDTLAEAYVTYEEQPREEWLINYPAQISLAGSQMWFAQVRLCQLFLAGGTSYVCERYRKSIRPLSACRTATITP